MANVVRRTWTERIDDEAFVAVAEFSETYRGMVFAASTFLLQPWGTWTARRRAREEAEVKLEVELRRGDHIERLKGGGFYQHRFGMPCVGHLRDLRR
jgi:hypothetical protein